MKRVDTSLQEFIEANLRRLPSWLSTPIRLVFDATTRWIDANAPQLGASIAFYTVFALAPLLIITIAVAGTVFGEDAARGQLVAQIRGLVGLPAAQAIETMIAASAIDRHGTLATVLGAVTIFIGATGVFAELRRALNALSDIQVAESVVGAFLRVRLIAIALVLGLGFLAIASLVVSALLAGLGGYVSNRWVGMQTVFASLDIAVSIGIMGTAFAGLLRWMPDRPSSPVGVWIGALTAATLFALGKSLIGLYLGRASVTSSFGAAASFVIILLWVWYSSQILLFGAALGLAYDARKNLNRRPLASPRGPEEAACLVGRH